MTRVGVGSVVVDPLMPPTFTVGLWDQTMTLTGSCLYADCTIKPTTTTSLTFFLTCRPRNRLALYDKPREFSMR